MKTLKRMGKISTKRVCQKIIIEMTMANRNQKNPPKKLLNPLWLLHI